MTDPSRSAARRPGRTTDLGPLAVAAAAGTLLAALHALGGGVLDAPPLRSPDEVGRWVAERDAVVVGMVGLRLVALAVGYHLLATTTLTVLARALHSGRLARLAWRATLPPLRGSLHRIVGLGLSAAAVAATTPVGSAAPAAASGPAAIEAVPPTGAAPGSAVAAPDASLPTASGLARPATAGAPLLGQAIVERLDGGTPAPGQAVMRALPPEGANPDAMSTPPTTGEARQRRLPDPEAGATPGSARMRRLGTEDAPTPGDTADRTDDTSTDPAAASGPERAERRASEGLDRSDDHGVAQHDRGTSGSGRNGPGRERTRGSGRATPTDPGPEPTSGSHRAAPSDLEPDRTSGSGRGEPADPEPRRPERSGPDTQGAPRAEHPAGPGTAGPAASPAERSGDGAGVGAGRVHVVRPGDHLWALAEAVMAERAGAAPGDHAVAAYWRRVLLANPQLVDPDLLLPNDHITLPPAPA